MVFESDCSKESGNYGCESCPGWQAEDGGFRERRFREVREIRFLSIPKGCSGQLEIFQGPPAAKSEEGRVQGWAEAGIATGQLLLTKACCKGRTSCSNAIRRRHGA